MDTQRWQRVSQLFDQVIDMAPAQRERVLDDECANDPQLRQQIIRMLELDESPHLLDQGVGVVIERVAQELDEADAEMAWLEQSSQGKLGQWKLQGVLGQGGSGAVFLAHRDDDPGHRVAIKRLRARWDGSVQALRFLQERRILASLSHPNIPRLIDHGLDAEMRPWFALELVEGIPITQWSDQQQLAPAQRISLFLRVCEAVQHAHARFVVHRDLKPSNILVTEEGHPMVLDFGVAKRLDVIEGQTRTGVMAGFTPEYAAPEQISGAVITTATDVYALGVVLYQLLTGRLPYVTDGFNLRQMAEAISEHIPVRLDQAIATGGDAICQQRLKSRSISLSGFVRYARGDLTRILQTALAKEPERRYAGVDSFVNDLQRFLQGKTVSVAGDTLRYRATKFVRRNRGAVAMGCVTLVVLLAGTAGIVYQWRQAQLQASVAIAEASRAEKQAGRAQATRDFLLDMLASTNPESNAKDAGEVTIREFLDQARKRIGDQFPGQPALKAELLGEVGTLYGDLGRFEDGAEVLAQALAVMPTGEAEPEWEQRTRLTLAYALTGSDLEAANSEVDKVLASLKDGDASLSLQLKIAELQATLAFMASGRDAAVEPMQRVLDLTRKIYGEDSPQWIDSAIEASYAFDDEAAGEMARKAVAYSSPKAGAEATVQHMLALWALSNAAAVPSPKEAIEAAERSLPLAEHFYGTNATRYARSVFFLVEPRLMVGPLPEAVARAQQSMEIYQSHNPRFPLIRPLKIRMASAWVRMGDYRRADAQLQEVLGDPDIRPDERASALLWQADLAVRTGDIEAARAAIGKVVSPDQYENRIRLLDSRIALRQGKFDEAMGHLAEHTEPTWQVELQRARILAGMADHRAAAKAAESALTLLVAAGAVDIPELDEARAIAAKG